MTKKQKKRMVRILITGAILAALFAVQPVGLWRAAFYLAAYVVIGYDIVEKAIKGIWAGRPFDENFLMTLATVGAFVLAFRTKSGEYTEAVAVMLFYQTGELFQSYAVGKSRKNIAAMMELRPDCANIERDGQLEQVDPAEVAVGSEIVVQPGEKIPLDGVVINGKANLNTALLTGESLPRVVEQGDTVYSGCVCLDSVLRVRTTTAFGESTASKVLELVENASSRKSRSEAFISRFARVYTPTVCIAAVLLAFAVPGACSVMGLPAHWASWIYRALTFLVVSCPCALVISIPLSFFAGLGCAGKQGILIKGSNYMEALAQVGCFVFDKTGTLTQGVFQVSGCEPIGISGERLLEYAALAEAASTHPISKSLRQAYGQQIDRSRVERVEEISGHGVIARVDGHCVAVGNSKLMDHQQIVYTDHPRRGTVVHLAIDGVYAGFLTIEDQVKPQAKMAIERLKKAGVRKTVMLTGDTETVAGQVAALLKIDEVHSELLPGDKVEQVEKLLGQTDNREKLAFVGDGINDAPVLTRADIGIAMGALGSDAAIEAADVVLMEDDPMQLVKAVLLSRRCIRIVRQNIAFSLIVKFSCLVLVAVGWAEMRLAVFADVGVMVLAVLNAMRALRYRE